MSTSIHEIRMAIQGREKLNVVHQTTNSDGSPKAGHPIQYREVIPVAVGTNANTGNKLVRVYQTGGGTNKSISPGYKLLKLDHTVIERAGDSKEASSHYNAQSSRLLSGGYNPNDSAFTSSQAYTMSDNVSRWDTGENLTSSGLENDIGRASNKNTENPFDIARRNMFKRGGRAGRLGSRMIGNRRSTSKGTQRSHSFDNSRIMPVNPVSQENPFNPRQSNFKRSRNTLGSRMLRR